MLSTRTLLTSLSCLLYGATYVTVNAFAFIPSNNNKRSTSSSSSSKSVLVLQMGLFDGVKDAFSAPALEQSAISKERETPIDRWMGWSVVSERDTQGQKPLSDANFVDSMDEKNYIIASLTKPMGIVFEENDADHGGIFVQSLKEDGIAYKDGSIKAGDQLIAVNCKKVSGLPFDDALGAIVDAEGGTVKLIFFRGTAKQFYGPTGASQKWIEEYISSKQ